MSFESPTSNNKPKSEQVTPSFLQEQIYLPKGLLPNKDLKQKYTTFIK
jgi:hypothetical protein